MSNIKIITISNEQDPQAVEFSQGLVKDLGKCLARFRGDFAFETNTKPNANDCTILILSEGVGQSAPIEAPDGILSNPRTLPISISPLGEDSSTLAASSRQPFLFWDKQLETDEVRLFRSNNHDTKANYWETITDLAIEIHQMYSKSEEKANKEYIFLSQENINFNAERENIKRDLIDLGYVVLPNEPLSSDIERCTNQITEALKQSKLAIQIVPPIYSIQFADHHLSLCEHQCNIAAQYMQSEGVDLKRIVWIPSNYEVTDEENQVFIEKLQRDHDQAHNTIVLKSSLEDLKKHYRQQLAISSSNGSSNDTTDVYLIDDSNGSRVPEDPIRIIEKMNLSMAINTKGITYSQHLAKLAQATRVVLYYTGKNEQWLRVKSKDILKSKGIDSARPLERIVLIKANEQLDTSKYEETFTDVLTDASKLTSILA